MRYTHGTMSMIARAVVLPEPNGPEVHEAFRMAYLEMHLWFVSACSHQRFQMRFNGQCQAFGVIAAFQQRYDA